MSEEIVDLKFLDDKRSPCRYGSRCYQKNPLHLSKYKHPAKRPIAGGSATTNVVAAAATTTVIDEAIDHDETKPIAKKPKLEDDTRSGAATASVNSSAEQAITLSTTTIITTNEQNEPPPPSSISIDPKNFIKSKFLVDMPPDFYHFWDFCRELNDKKPPEDALLNVGLRLVGAYDVLAGKFATSENVDDDQYLLHWRFYHDIPEFQTVLVGDDTATGYHIGYFRDAPNESPVFLAANNAEKDGKFTIMGENIFAAINSYLDERKKSEDPFKKMRIAKLSTALKIYTDKLGLSLAPVMTSAIRKRQAKTVARTFNTIGLVVPYNKKTELGYRKLAMSDSALIKLLDKLQRAENEGERNAFLSRLQQDLLTWTSIATDECDFGTGIELGWNIVCHGVDTLNATAARFLAISYRLLDRPEFARIAEAHMKRRRKGTDLSILSSC